MSKLRWDLRVEQDLADWAEDYAAERGTSRTEVVELALKELRAATATLGYGTSSVAEIFDRPVYRSQGSVSRRCFRCSRQDCVSRVFLNPSDPEDFVPVCADHGPMVRDVNRSYLGGPTPV